MKKIKILHIFRKMDMGGAESLILNLYRHIDREKYSFEFCVVDSEPGYYDKEIIKLGGKIHILPDCKKGLFKYVTSLSLLLKNNKFDVVHSHVHWFSGVNLTIAMLQKIPVRISHSHTYNSLNKSITRTVYEVLMKMSIRMAGTDFLACSIPAGIELYNEGNFTVLNNAIDIKRFQEKIFSKNDYKNKLNLSREDFVLCHVGGFRPEKNHDFIIELFHEISKSKGNAKLLLVGGGDLKKIIEKKVADLNLEKKVIFLGIREDIEDILAASDCFIFPSIFEGLGMAIIEAQVSGLPCIVSDRIPKDVDISGEVQFLPLSNLQLWEDAILSASPEINHIRDFSHYDISIVTKQLTTIYSNKVIGH